ncbi:MAG TPA: CoA pyrophosphatase [Gemmatimonadales bacterium]|nr:CoA pyrophosphatase [Gemmatimonadales bacterium]
MITLAAVRHSLAGYRPKIAQWPEAQPAAVALILVEGADGLAALFIHRAEQVGDPWSGQVALPGGHREPTDPDLLATAVREAREETGVDLTAAERLGALDDLAPRTPTLPPVVVRPFVFGLTERPRLGTSPEVQRAFWLPLARLTAPAARGEITLALRDATRTFPAYHVDGEVIWGMTERIVTPFLELIGAL